MRHTLLGWSPLTANEIANRISTQPVYQFPGDFVLISESGEGISPKKVQIATSLTATPLYFYHYSKGILTHGSNVFEVARRAGLPWIFDAEAVTELALFEHVTENRSLHRDIKRFDACSVYTWEEGADLKCESQLDAFNRKVSEAPQVQLDDALEVLRTIAGEIADCGKAINLSLSAGFDSRLILALCLDQGIRPNAATFGFDDSTDVVIARKIAGHFGVPLRQVTPTLDNYLKSSGEIIELTSGTKPVQHWHTHIFSKNSGFSSDSLHLSGSNGESARSYYLDKGILSRLANLPGSAAFFEPFLYFHFSPLLRLRKLKTCKPSTFYAQSGYPVGNAFRHHDSRLMSGSLMQRLDDFYIFERVRNFIGAGLALYRSFSPTTSPFLDARFIAAVASLPRSAKLNNRFHRYAIDKLSKPLNDFPSDETGLPLPSQPKFLYWLKKPPVKGYDLRDKLLTSQKTVEILMEDRSLDEFVNRSTREQLIKYRRTSFLSFLLTMHYLNEHLKVRNLR